MQKNMKKSGALKFKRNLLKRVDVEMKLKSLKKRISSKTFFGESITGRFVKKMITNS